MTGPEIIEVCKGQVYEAWKQFRALPSGDDLAAFVYVTGPTEIEVVVAARETLIDKLSEEGVDFSNNPEVRSRASDNNPMPSIGIWVLIGQHDANGKRSVFITRFIEPLFSRIGGGVPIGQA